MQANRKILVISFSPIARDPRVRRQLDLLKAHGELTVVGYGAAPDAMVEWIGIDEPGRLSLPAKAGKALALLLRRHEHVYWHSPLIGAARTLLVGRHFDLIVANDIDALPLANIVADGAPLLFDAHEYFTGEHAERWLWNALFAPYRYYLAQHYGQHACWYTVCDGIARRLADEFARSVEVLPNAAPYQTLPVVTNHGPIRLVHHGAAMPARQLELMIDTMDLLGQGYTLDLMLMPSVPGYYRQLQERVERSPNVRLIDPVPMPRICAALNGYDLGLYLIPPVNINNRYSLPNKFFEFIQARLAIVIGPSPEMAALVRRHGLGQVAADFTPQALAEAVRTLGRPQIVQIKQAVDRAASELSFESYAAGLTSDVRAMLEPRSCVG